MLVSCDSCSGQPPSPSSLTDCLLWHLLHRPGDTAWLSPSGEKVAWRTLAGAVLRSLQSLRDLGLRSQDVIATQLENGWPAVVTAIAIDALDGIESPLDMRLQSAEVQSRAARLPASCILDSESWQVVQPNQFNDAGIKLSDEELIDQLRLIVAGQATDARALVLWTSGTTREPEGVVLSRRALLANATGKLAAVPQEISDRRLTVLPLAHAYARTCDLITWLISGCSLAVGSGWQAIETQGPHVRPTLVNLVAFLIDKLLKPEAEWSTSKCRERLRLLGMDAVRIVGCGGVALGVQQFQRLQELGIVPIQGYGLTEAGPVICSATPGDARPGVVGRPVIGTEIKLTKENEILSRGPGQMMEYWEHPQATSARVTAEGWLKTGDLGVIEADGALRVLGRSDEVLVFSTGMKLHPVEYEQAFADVSGVRRVILRAVGTEIEAIVEAEAGFDRRQFWNRVQMQEQARGELPRLRGLWLLGEPLSEARCELTTKGTVRRHVVWQRFVECDGKKIRGRDSYEPRPL